MKIPIPKTNQVASFLATFCRSGHKLALLLLGVGLFWVYWPTFGNLLGKWESDPQYSHGFVVPLFSLYLLWRRRQQLDGGKPSCWGLLLLAVGLGLRFCGTYLY